MTYMKKYVFKVSLLALFWMGSNIAHAIPIVSLTSNASLFNVGDSITVSANISGLGNFEAQSLSVFDVDLLFDASQFTFQSITTTSFLGNELLGEVFNAIDTSTAGVGGINITQVSFLDPSSTDCFFCLEPFLDVIQPGGFELFSVNFLITSVGSNTFNIAANEFGNGIGDPLAVSLNSTVDVLVRDGVTSIPEPNVLSLLGLGLLGLGFTSRKIGDIHKKKIGKRFGTSII